MLRSLATAGLLLASLRGAWAGDDKELEEAIQKFKKGMSNPSAPERAAAVADLSAMKCEKTALTLGGLLGADAEPVRKAAARGLGGFTEYKRIVTPLLLAGLSANAKEPRVKEAIFEALGRLEDESALPAVHAHFEDRDAGVASAALLCSAEIRKASSIDLILNLMRKYEKIDAQAGKGGGAYGGGPDPRQKLAQEVLPSALKAMQRISGEKWTTVKDWDLWWSQHKATFKVDK